MSNRFGQAYGLTAITPILGGLDETGVPHDVALRRELRALNTAPESPFAYLATTHLARWVILDEAPFESIPAKVDHFQSKYLLFTSNFDGAGDSSDVALARYVESMRTAIPGILARLYGHCVGFRGTSDARAWLNYVKECQVTTTFFFGAYPDASVDQVLRALEMQKRVGDFIADQQDARPTPAALQKAFIELRTSLAQAPTRRPGTYP